DRPGTRGARPGRPGPGQPGDREQAGAEPEDGPQSRLQHLDQAAGRRPRPGHRPGQGRGHGTLVPGLRDIRRISSWRGAFISRESRERYPMTAGRRVAESVIDGSVSVEENRIMTAETAC